MTKRTTDHMISVKEARSWLDPSTGPKPEVPSPLLVDRYARTVIAQAKQIERVRNVLNSIAREKAESEHARDHGYDNPEWHETTADALEYVIDLLTEALERDT